MSHIMIASPDKIYTASLTDLFVREGYQVSYVGADIDLEWLSSSSDQVDLIVVDLGFADESQLTKCQQIRARTTIPLMLITPLFDRNQARALLTCGADRVLGKSISSRELKSHVLSLFRRRALNRS